MSSAKAKVFDAVISPSAARSTTFSGVSSATTAHAHEEQQQLGLASVEKIEAARRDQRDEAEATTRHDGGDIAGEWLTEHRGEGCLSESVGGNEYEG